MMALYLEMKSLLNENWTATDILRALAAAYATSAVSVDDGFADDDDTEETRRVVAILQAAIDRINLTEQE